MDWHHILGDSNTFSFFLRKKLLWPVQESLRVPIFEMHCQRNNLESISKTLRRLCVPIDISSGE